MEDHIKGQKVMLQKALHAISSQLPSGWIPEVVVLEWMFLINTSPLSTLWLKEFSLFLFRRFVHPHFLACSGEVHLIFDNPRN